MAYMVGGDQNLGGLAGSGGTVTLGMFAANPANLTVGSNNASTSFTGGVISGYGAFTKIGSGQLYLGGTNTYSGPTTISSGSIQLASSLALPAAGNDLTVAGPALLDLNTYSPTVGGLFGAGTVTDSSDANGGTLFANSGSFSGLLTGNMGLTMVGAGSLNLTGTATSPGR